MVAGASRGLGFAVAQALASEGALVSIASRDEASIARRRNDLGCEHVLATPVDVAIGRRHPALGARHRRQVRRRRSALRQRAADRRPAPRSPSTMRRGRVRWTAALQRAADGARGGAVDDGARRRRHPDVDVVVGQGADPESRALDRAARVGVRAGEDPGARAGGRRRFASTRSFPGRIDTDRVMQLDEINGKKQGISAEQAKAKSMAAIPLGRYGEAEEFGRVAAFLLSDAASYMTGATVQVDGGLIRSVLCPPSGSDILQSMRDEKGAARSVDQRRGCASARRRRRSSAVGVGVHARRAVEDALRRGGDAEAAGSTPS